MAERSEGDVGLLNRTVSALLECIERSSGTTEDGLSWLTPRVAASLTVGDGALSRGEERPSHALAARIAKENPTMLYWMASNGMEITESVGADIALPPSVDGGDDFDSTNTRPPSKPFVREIARRLIQWSRRGSFPVKFTRIPLLDETSPADVPRLNALTGDVARFVASSSTADAASVLRGIGLDGIRSLLGLRRTAGTKPEEFPPGRGEMVAAFRSRHSASSGAALTVGARALAKHCQRAHDGWWGNGLEGTESQKNALADAVLVRILSGAVWLNVHSLPHDLPIFEVRQRDGYGARWSCAPPAFEFRGFLEPQMADGHEKGWQH